MDKGESRKELTQRLMDMGEGIAKTRAERIIRTETVAAVEYMRYETARLN